MQHDHKSSSKSSTKPHASAKPKSGDGQKKYTAASRRAQAHAANRRLPGNVTANCLAGCTRDYLKSVHNFWEPSSACIPIPPCFPSEKSHVFVKGTMTTGTTIGFVIFDPLQAIINNATSPPVRVTSAPYAGTTIVGSGTGVTPYQSNSIYTQANVDAGSIQWRCISAGIRLRFIGNTMDDGGSIAFVTEPEHRTVVGLTATGLRAYDCSTTYSNKRDQWMCTRWFATSPMEIAYSNTMGLLPDGESHQFCLGAIASAISGTASIYDYECYANFEVIGPGARNKTTNMSDGVGGTAALEFLTDNVTSQFPSLQQLYAGVDRIVKTGSGIYQAYQRGMSILNGTHNQFKIEL